ncbi:hypothetical protein BH18VER1_BH18VER1_16440 [soil metagenome]
MRCWFAAFLFVPVATLFALDQEVHAPDDMPLEIEPPVLIQNVAPVATDAEQFDVEKTERDLAHAEKNAASGERLYKSGVISKVEAEERALKVVRLTAKLAETRLQQAKLNLEQLKSRNAAGVVSGNDVVIAEAATKEAEEAAAAAANVRRRAETEAAARNVQRQQKLIALGSGRKADLTRAQQKLTELLQPND